MHHKSLKKQETAHAEESWSYDYDTYWTDDWSGHESYYGYDGDYSQGDWYNWSYFASAEELTESEDKHFRSEDVNPEDGQIDKINRFCFSGICLFRSFGHELVEAFAFMLLFVSLLYQCFTDSNRFLFKSIRQVEKSFSTENGDLHSFQRRTCPLSSVSTEECVFLNYDHGAQQALLCEYVVLGWLAAIRRIEKECRRCRLPQVFIDPVPGLPKGGKLLHHPPPTPPNPPPKKGSSATNSSKKEQKKTIQNVPKT